MGDVVWKYSLDPGRRWGSSASHLKRYKNSSRGARISTPTDKLVQTLMIAYLLSFCEVILAYLSITVVPLFIPVLFDPRGQGLIFNHCTFFHSEPLISVYSALLTYSAS